MARCEEEPVKSPRRVRSRVSSARTQILVPSQADIPDSNPEPPPAASFEAPVFATKLVAFDKRFSKWVHENCLSEFTYAFLRFFEYSGDGLFWIPATAIFWLAPSSTSPELRAFALNLFICLLFDLIVVGTIKCAVRRKRPQYNRGHLVIVSMDRYSFPSGHSTRAFMLLTLFSLHTPLWQTTITQTLASNPKWETLVPNPNSNPNSSFMGEYVFSCLGDHGVLVVGRCVFSLWVLATCCARVVLGRHYFFDVVGGVVVGVLEGVVAHLALRVPVRVSEMHHEYVVGLVVGVYEGVLWSVVGGRDGFGEGERMISEANEGAL